MTFNKCSHHESAALEINLRQAVQSVSELEFSLNRRQPKNKEWMVKIGPYELSRYYDTGGGPCPELEPGHYPYGWAPHQMLAWQGFKNYGLNTGAGRLAYCWLYCIAKNAHDYNGVIPEKYNVVTSSHDVFVEYGNVGTKFPTSRRKVSAG